MKLLAFFSLTFLSFLLVQNELPSDDFIDLTNRYASDSLRTILAPDFQLRRTYTSYYNDRESFLGEYLTRAKLYNGKFYVTKVLSATEPKKFLVRDESDYLKYLGAEPHTWHITIKRNQDNKVSEVVFDTTRSFSQYVSAVREKELLFEKWLKHTYPKESLLSLNENELLLFKRMKAYAEAQ